MPPEIETSSGGMSESSDFTASNTDTAPVEETFGGSGGPGDSGFFSEEPILEGSGSDSGSSNGGSTGGSGESGMMAGGSPAGPGDAAGSSMGGFGSSGNAEIGNGSSGSFEANPFAAGGNGVAGSGSSGSMDSGIQESRLQSFHASSDLKDVHFKFDQYGLDNNSKRVLQENASFLKSNPDMRVEIQGHCDERGTNNYNIALGERRAHSTKKFLVSQGVDSSRVNIISYGEEKPFCFDSNESCWYQNRRAHFMVSK